MKKVWKKPLLVLASLALTFSVTACGGSKDKEAGAPAAGGSKELVVVDWGGASSEAAKKTVYEPFEKANNVKITVVSPTDVGKLKAMVQSGAVEWDVVNSDTDVALRLEKEGLLEKLDYTQIKKDGVYPELVTDCSIGLQVYFTNIAYNTEAFPGGKHPKTWAEFWDTKTFPGARSLYKNPVGTLEAALLADGVAPDKLYPLDVDRAFKSLGKIKKDVKVWWDAGAQPPQLLGTKEVVAAAAWNGRVSSAKAQGSPIDNEFNQSLGMATSWVIPKGAPHKDLAQKFIAYAVTAESQAAYSKSIDYAPTNKKALDMLPNDVKQRIGQTPERVEKQILINNKWWLDNYDKIAERFNKFMLE
ncbi:putative spermidine/putrescine transport system substrate-binding protein [Aneurinibacillus soli]|uniref:Spermidine/putrescine ABC transporter periplasmic substrate-binding protein n=1 Tax=Aneurinibacillus soli TaxID=1500254 RepID=A0A0U4NK31_9BACL|nr:ABC transporter substrate-binding protein [Aneurinibacillus soli]PYE62850.1 putative spermidine/putrescine transport system substrate-binding protein [Aneurinibacillus soli]BAU29092.1 spermidine/putrescine ABC transporter periplasmic substrate-binding protein [Aneurinibacillus soli]